MFLLLGVKSFGERTVGVPMPTLFLTAVSTLSAVMFLAVRAVYATLPSLESRPSRRCSLPIYV